LIPATVGVFSTGETFGDAIYKVVFLRALRAAFPGARLTWFVTGTTLYASSLASVAAASSAVRAAHDRRRFLTQQAEICGAAFEPPMLKCTQ